MPSEPFTFRCGIERRKALERLTRNAGQPSPGMFLNKIIDVLDVQVQGPFDVRDITIVIAEKPVGANGRLPE